MGGTEKKFKLGMNTWPARWHFGCKCCRCICNQSCSLKRGPHFRGCTEAHLTPWARA